MRLAAGDVRPGIANSNLRASRAVAFALKGMWNEAGLKRRRIETVSLIIPDQAVRMAFVPLEGREPRSAEGAAMARWALRDLFPPETDDCRIDWAILSSESLPDGEGWLFTLAAAVDVVREYEAILEGLGLSAGRVIPMTMALAAAAAPTRAPTPGTARIVLSEIGGLVAALVEADGVPRLHRAWRRPPADLGADLRAIDRYLEQRLELKIVEAAIAGGKRWRRQVTKACEALGWHATPVSRWSAHRAATRW